MDKSKFLIGVGISILVAATGCIAMAAEGQSSMPRHEVIHSGLEKGTAFESTSITFGPNSAALTAQDKVAIRELVKTMRQMGTVSRAKVAAWSDKAHPYKGDLPQSDQKLAGQRIKTIESFLKKEEGLSGVKAFNMTENRHWLGRMIHSEEAELDAAFAKRGTAPVSNHEFRAIKEEGGPSKAVIILEHKVKSGK